MSKEVLEVQAERGVQPGDLQSDEGGKDEAAHCLDEGGDVGLFDLGGEDLTGWDEKVCTAEMGGGGVQAEGDIKDMLAETQMLLQDVTEVETSNTVLDLQTPIKNRFIIIEY